MKRKLFTIGLLLICLVALTACGKKSNAKEEMLSMEMEDQIEGTTTLYYPKSLSFSIKQVPVETGNRLELYSHDYSAKINISYEIMVTENYNSFVKNCKETKAYKEYTWNEYKGLACGDESEVKFAVKLYESEIGYVRVLSGIFEPDTTTGRSLPNMITVFNQKGIQDWLSTIEYKK